MEKKAESAVLTLAQSAGFDADNFHVAHALRALLKQIVDKGTSIDSGGGPDNTDLWPTIRGVEYYINIRKSNAQLAKESRR